MTADQRAARLFIRAASQGLDGPTEMQVHEAITDAENEIIQDIMVLFMQSKRADMADWLHKKLELKQIDNEPQL